MYLKRLEVQGFKSFANKTALEFSPGVTCVVGPNGTGKTNVADSIRWVLGEHSSRALRARRTEDVIFAGSDKRAPMGFAETSIALDNSAQWLPVEFNEVVVTRRAYRNGESEYLINNAKVRLRDVIELFTKAQVGQNSYAFMGQGMVEQAISLRPEDRRALIEEAADVRQYRTKLEDARNKLKATRENVERARMLVREIEPRINQLERQAGRAVKYRELTRELAETLHVWYAHQWRDVNDQLLAAITTHDQRTEEVAVAKVDARACEDGLAQLRAAIDERRREIAEREERLRSMLDYVRDLERRTALDSERAKMLTERIEELTTELAALRTEQSSQDVDAPVDDTSALEARLDEARTQLTGHRSRLASVEQELAALQRTAIVSEGLAARARAQSEEISRGAQEAVDNVARLRRERAASIAERRKTIVELAAWAKQFARGAGAQHSAAELAAAVEKRARLADTLARLRDEQAAADAEMRELRAEADSVRARMEVLEAIEVRPQPPDAGIRAILVSGGLLKGEDGTGALTLEGVRGLVGQLIRVPSGLESAIEAALADNLFAIVFDRQADVKAAVDMLLGGDAGRATMYALDGFQESRPLNLIKERGVIGVASSLVRCESRYRRLVDTLLGRTVVVEDLAMAHRFVKRGLASAVATRNGVLLRPVGSISAGVAAAAHAAFVYEREAGDLPDRVAQIEPDIEARATKLAEATERISDTQRRITEADALIHKLRDQTARSEAERSAARGRLATFGSRLGALTAERNRCDVEIALIDDRSAIDAALRDDVTRQAIAAEEQEQAARRAMSELESVRTQLTDAIAESAATVAHLDGQLRSERVIAAPSVAVRARVNGQIVAKEEQRARFLQESQAIVSRLDATQRELNGKTSEVSALREETEPARQELSQFESRERSLGAELVEASGRMRDAERSLIDSDNDARILREELDSLRVGLETEGFITTADGDVIRAPEPDEAPQSAPKGNSEGLPRWMSGDGEMPTVAGGTSINATEVRDRIAELRGQIRGLGPVNETAAGDYTENRERYDFLTTQLVDLQQAEAQLLEAVDELEVVIREKFRETFKIVNKEFERYFSAFFRGGAARLELGETDDEGLPGVEIIAQPPGKKLGSLALLSGGEKSLTAVALLFALLSANPSPICVLDEVDAALDEANVGRFVDELRALSERTQFIIITHNRRTIENADMIYGVSMGADNVSRVLSLKLADVQVE